MPLKHPKCNPGAVQGEGVRARPVLTCMCWEGTPAAPLPSASLSVAMAGAWGSSSVSLPPTSSWGSAWKSAPHQPSGWPDISLSCHFLSSALYSLFEHASLTTRALKQVGIGSKTSQMLRAPLHCLPRNKGCLQ